MPDVRARLIEVGLEAVSNSPDAFAKYIRTETDKWARVVKQANIKVE
jgi:tripartite-type tricarboxylate transporter receptor subunit TctC